MKYIKETEIYRCLRRNIINTEGGISFAGSISDKEYVNYVMYRFGANLVNGRFDAVMSDMFDYFGELLMVTVSNTKDCPVDVMKKVKSMATYLDRGYLRDFDNIESSRMKTAINELKSNYNDLITFYSVGGSSVKQTCKKIFDSDGDFYKEYKNINYDMKPTGTNNMIEYVAYVLGSILTRDNEMYRQISSSIFNHAIKVINSNFRLRETYQPFSSIRFSSDIKYNPGKSNIYTDKVGGVNGDILVGIDMFACALAYDINRKKYKENSDRYSNYLRGEEGVADKFNEFIGMRRKSQNVKYDTKKTSSNISVDLYYNGFSRGSYHQSTMNGMNLHLLKSSKFYGKDIQDYLSGKKDPGGIVFAFSSIETYLEGSEYFYKCMLRTQRSSSPIVGYVDKSSRKAYVVDSKGDLFDPESMSKIDIDEFIKYKDTTYSPFEIDKEISGIRYERIFFSTRTKSTIIS